MNTPSPRASRRWLVFACLAIVALIALGGAFWWWNSDDGGGPPADDPQGPVEVVPLAVEPATYREVVSAFLTGVAAIDADANDRARQELTRATELVPEEPASWMNLGLVGIRVDDADLATSSLAKAGELAPGNGTIDRLLGLFESRRGDSDAAIEHLRRAVDKNPEDVKAMYALAEEVERRQAGPEASAEAAKLFDAILEHRPDNLAVLLERARLAVKDADADALAKIVEQLRPLSVDWPERTVAQFQSVAAIVEEGITPQSAIRVTVLKNLLLAEADFRHDLRALKSDAGVVGEPVRTFLRLPPPPAHPAPPDTELTFTFEPLATDGGSATALATVPAVTGGEPAVFVADADVVRRITGDAFEHPFPGGSEAVTPAPDGLLAVDWNSDMVIDLVLAGAGGVRLLQAGEGGTFTDVTDAAQLPDETRDAPALGAWAIDIELDGDLDLLVGRTEGTADLLLNRGDGTFDVQQPFEGVAGLRGFAWADFSGDGLPDAALLDAGGALHVFVNERAGRYRRLEPAPDATSVVAVTAADVDGDGRIDVVALKDDGSVGAMALDDGASWPRRWKSRVVAETKIATSPASRLAVADLDNSGSVDLVVAGEDSTAIWLGDGAGEFQPLIAAPVLRGLAVLDLTDDGRLDLVGLQPGGNPVRGTNVGTKAYHWQILRPRAAEVMGDDRINSFGLGGEVQVRAGLLVQTQVMTGPTLHFGLGEHSGGDLARIVWPNGTVQVEFDTPADAAVSAVQRLKGSCPFVYTFDGTGMTFVTDFLWRSPLGLRINAQDTAGVSQTEDWILIRGDQLKPRDDHYDVRITAELWETHYWDFVSLMVVDHPPGTQVFVDERFAKSPPALAVYVTGPLYSVMARDDRGDDVTDVIAAIDRRYLDSFGLGQYQGVTRDHWVEIELGDDVPRTNGLRLVARGWVYPTDSSINVALGQGSHDPPQGLVLEVPDADGTWTVARDDLGFPAGKDKTILLDLDGLFPPDGSRRFRLRTNLEVYWDQLAVAVAGDAATIETQRLAPKTAELRHRGYAQISRTSRSAPELPDYAARTGTVQRWNDLTGYYTRFGDVKPLLEAVDDRYVIANAGDELALQFPVPPPREGWIRDFVLIGDGWNKDGDYNTAWSGTVLPLPSHDRPAYDEPPGPLHEDPVYRRHAGDWDVYHTRYVTPETFLNGLHHSAGPSEADTNSERK